MKPPTVKHLVGKYELGRTIGEGAFAKVKFARNTENGEPVAIKILDKEKVLKHKMAEQIKREIEIMKRIKHPHVVRLYEVMASRTKIFIVLEYVTGGELFDKILSHGRMKEDEARRYFQQLMDAIDYCHSRGVFHRDLKPENLLLDAGGNLRVSDFGLSALSQQIKDDGLLHTTCGTPNYVAPEVLDDSGYDGAKADIWSCGVILFVLLAGYLPFDDSNLMNLYRKISVAEFTCPAWLSFGARKLLTRIMDPNPVTRITIPEILEDEWFKKKCYKPLVSDEKDKTYLDDVEAIFQDLKEHHVTEKKEEHPTPMNAFELIAMSKGLNLEYLFDAEQDYKTETRFTSKCPPNDIIKKIEQSVKPLGFQVQKKNYKMRLDNVKAGRKGKLSVATEVMAQEEESNFAQSRNTLIGSSHPMPLSHELGNLQDNHAEVNSSDKEAEDEPKSAVCTQKTRKRTSAVWDFFERINVKGVAKARCHYCKAVLTAAATGGTSHLKKHVEKTCSGRHLRLGKGASAVQQKLSIVTQSDGSTTLEMKQNINKAFDQEVSRRELVRMIVMHEYPMAMVEHIGFKRFVESLNPSFKMISRITLRADVMKLYESERRNLKDLLDHNKSRVAITTDMWTASNQKKGYMVVTAHFIDEGWNLRNRTLRFTYVPCPHTKGVISKVLLDCVSQYGLESKISSVVVDNCSTNDAMIDILLKKFEKKSLVLSGAFLHMRCSAHILNLIVKDGLDVIYSGIEKIRECIAFWTLTPKRIEKFEEACRFLKVSTSKVLCLDCKTRWNSTYLMLQSAFPYKDVFRRLKRVYSRFKFVVPSDDDWHLASIVCEKLEIFYKATVVFSGRRYPTANLFFRKVCMIKIALKSWLESDVEVVRCMASNMIEKFDKYWSQINGILAIASILDPRNKMDCVDYYFRRLYDDEADVELDRIRKIFDCLLNEYQKKTVESTSERGGSSKALLRDSLKRSITESSIVDEEDEFAQIKRTKIRKVSVKCELDHYLESDTLPESDRFDILNFWKSDLKYPTLQKIARDILAIPISTVASESAFSTGGRVVSPHRSRLHAKTVEALMCLQSWMTEDIKGTTTLENLYACATVGEDSDNEDGSEVIDVCDMDIDEDNGDDFD